MGLSCNGGEAGMSVVPNSALDTDRPQDLQIAHVLFMDLVGYSSLPMDEQTRFLSELQEVVRATDDFRRAEAKGELISLPTGDGMALVFFHNPVAPIRCAVDISRALRNRRHLKLRMGIHSGAVYRVQDINAHNNVAGSGINMAQRVMDAGDAGHILLSSTMAELLKEIRQWSSAIHDLGPCEVKHGVRIHLYNFFTGTVGNPELPEKLRERPATASLLYELQAQPDERYAREIELHYQLIASDESVRQITQCLATALSIQAATAIRRHAAVATLAFDSDTLNEALTMIAAGHSFSRVDPAGEVPEQLESRPWNVAGLLYESLTLAAERIQTAQRMLESLTGATHQTFPRELQERSWRADEALRNGLRSTGAERRAYHQNALSLLRRVVDDRAGRRDHAAWFQLGWLAWKHAQRLHEAEEAFAQCARLTTVTRDLFYVESLRHVAHIRYLRGNIVGAYRAIADALQVSLDPEVLFDGARYAALTGRISEAQEWIAQCIQRSPAVAISALAEADFTALARELHELISRVLSQARYQARTMVTHWSDALDRIASWQEQSGHTVELPTYLGRSCADAAASEVTDAGYLTVLEIERYAARASAPALAFATRELEEEACRRRDATAALKEELENAIHEAGWESSPEVRQKEAEAEAAERECKALLEAPPPLEEHALAGCGIMLAGAAFLGGLAALHGEIAAVLRTPVGLLLSAVMLGGWAFIPILRWMRYRMQADAVMEKALAARRAAEELQARIIAETPSELSERIESLRQQLQEAEAGKARMDELLATIKESNR
jgi:class 3 adenylate cyclase